MTKSSKDDGWNVDMLEILEELDMEDIATSQDFALREPHVPIIPEVELKEQEEKLYHTVVNRGPVTIITDAGVIRIEPNEGCTAGDVFSQAYIDFCGDIKQMYINRSKAKSYSETNDRRIKSEYFRLWNRYYRRSTKTGAEICRTMLEELPSTVKAYTLQNWVCDWKRGMNIPTQPSRET